ncbi:unnamed protein product [Ambrosiozyma monospora]|uniref:Unnamed protein product n=1 Tax=Ambrosiozyma monospora TaxID=43982 RepID=A0ACB5T736_AMBMO|nr:unnamed protein product [Ambrosiozyma monospora]
MVMFHFAILPFLLQLLYLTSTAESKEAWQTSLRLPGYNAYVSGCMSTTTTLYTFNYGISAYGRQYSFNKICNYPPATGTFLYCLSGLLGQDKMKEVLQTFNRQCMTYTETDYGIQHFVDQYNNASNYIVEPSSIENISLPLYVPTYPNLTYAQGYTDSVTAFYTNYDLSVAFAYGQLIYFAVVMLLGGLYKLIKAMNLQQSLVHPIINSFRSYVTIPSMFPNGKMWRPWGGYKIFTGLFPDRLDSIICFGYVLLHIIFLVYPYHSSSKHFYMYKSTAAEIRQYLADRAGIMAFGEIPLLILFAGRNNFLTFFSGFKFSSFIHFHKMVSRTMIIMAIIHSSNYTIIEKAYWASALKERYFACGLAATTLAGCIWLFSFHPLRTRAYEIFLYTHIIMVAAFVAMCWYHCKEQGLCEYIVASCAIWASDRVARIVRMCAFGYHKAEITVVNEESFKVCLRKPSNFSSHPGQYAFVYFTDSLLWFQSHPFSLLNDGEHVFFYIKVKKGITKRIFDELIANDGVLSKKICIEGPYGEPSFVGKYDNALLMTAGSGMPGIFNHALNLSVKEKPQNIKLIWINKTMEDMNFYIADLLSKLKDTRIIIDIYLTRETSVESAKSAYGDSNNNLTSVSFSSSEDYSDENSNKEGMIRLELVDKDVPSFINIKVGKPNMDELIPQEIESFGGGSVGIIACGPPVMMDHLNHAVSHEVLRYHSRLDYFDEYQTW